MNYYDNTSHGRRTENAIAAIVLAVAALAIAAYVGRNVIAADRAVTRYGLIIDARNAAENVHP